MVRLPSGEQDSLRPGTVQPSLMEGCEVAEVAPHIRRATSAASCNMMWCLANPAADFAKEGCAFGRRVGLKLYGLQPDLATSQPSRRLLPLLQTSRLVMDVLVTLSDLYGVSKTLLSVPCHPSCYCLDPWRAPMETQWRSTLPQSRRSPRSSPPTRRSWSGRLPRRPRIRSRSCCYRDSNTGCGNGGTRVPTRSTGGSSAESPPNTAKTTNS